MYTCIEVSLFNEVDIIVEVSLNGAHLCCEKSVAQGWCGGARSWFVRTNE